MKWTRASLRTAMAVLVLGAVVIACMPAGLSSNALRPGAPQLHGSSAATACRVTRVIDGDTVDLRCPGTQAFRARLTGFDTPETFEPRCRAEAQLGRQATQRLRQLVRQAARVEARLGGWDRHGRRLVGLRLDGRDVGQTLIAEGLALRYNGGRRVNWCAVLA